MNSGSFALAYAYYLKAFAEMTFLAAKRQGLKLKDDFVGEKDGEYSLEYFEVKAKTSLHKCEAILERLGA